MLEDDHLLEHAKCRADNVSKVIFVDLPLPREVRLVD